MVSAVTLANADQVDKNEKSGVAKTPYPNLTLLIKIMLARSRPC